MATAEAVHLRDTRANQPAAAVWNAGVIYCVTDEGGIQERSNGTIWESYSPASVDESNVAITGGSITNLSTLEIPVGAAPTVATDGEIAGDTTVADFSTGVVRVFLNEEQGVVAMPIAQFTAPVNGYVVTYNAANDEFELAAAAGGGDVLGPGVAVTDNAAVLWNGTGGTSVKNSTLVVGASDATIGGNGLYRAGGTDVPVADGGTGVSSLTAYAPMFGGTTGTGAVQSGTVGTSGQLLTSNGAGALPTFQTRQGLTQVARTEVSGGAVTTIGFTGLDLDTAGHYIIKMALKNAGASSPDILMYFNSDTTATNYNNELMSASGASVTAARADSARIAILDASAYIIAELEIHKPAGAGEVRSIARTTRLAATTIALNVVAHVWESANNPTTIDFTSSVASAIDNGSYIEIWRQTYV